MARGLPRRIASATASLLAVLVLTVLVAEGMLDEWEPRPRTQVAMDLLPATERWPEWDPSIPYWERATDRQNLECLRQRPDAPRVLVLGDSVFFGFQVPAEEVFTRRIQRDLEARAPGTAPCVLNFAQSGFSGQQMLELARVLLPRLKPDLLVWQSWWSNATTYTLLGDAAYVLDQYRCGPDGAPAVFGLPDAWNGWLFVHSWLYRYASLALGAGPPLPPSVQWLPVVAQRLRAARDLARAAGTRMVVVVDPALDAPFDAPSDLTRSRDRDVAGIAADLGIPVVFLDQRLAGRDVARLRLDTCCHFNAEGHAALAEVLADVLSGEWPARPTAAGR